MSNRHVRSMVVATLSMITLLAACSGGGGGSEPAPPPAPVSPPPASQTPDPAPMPAPAPASAPAPQPPAVPPSSQAGPSSTQIATEAEAVLFLNRATFGARQQDIDALVGRDAAEWLAGEFAKPQTTFLPDLQARYEANGGQLPRFANSPATWNAFILADDQLRMRTLFALSQILVVSDGANGGANEARRTAYYLDRLGTHAFGNYRALLQDVTYAPIMGEYLTYMGNKKGDPRRGSMPDENYAREIMQLFTIGLVTLNPDGTPVTDGTGQPEGTYTNDDVMGLARVFTGLRLAGGDSRGRNADADATFTPMEMFEGDHSALEKTFLGMTIPPNTPGDETIRLALDALFEHPNVGPFLATRMIQRFTASHPEPAYVERVTAAFETGQFTAPNGRTFGAGTRGDLEAMVAAILLDQSLFDGSIGPAEGKIREPVLRFVHWARAFDLSNVDAANEKDLADTGRPDRALAQHPIRSPSVFNFYRPGFLAPQTETGDASLTAPELQIFSSVAPIGYANFMAEFILDSTPTENGGPSFVPDYGTEIGLADDPAALVDHLNIYLAGGMLTADTQSRIIDMVSTVTLEDETLAEDRRKRAEVAIFGVVNSPAFAMAY